MRSLIYYPGFEPVNQDWIKFALLYLEQIQPIVPESADLQLSDAMRDVERFTDLVKPYRPSFDEGLHATADAIAQVEKVMRYPSEFEHVFHTPEIPRVWREPGEETTELWDEKFTYSWKEFCFENGLGVESENGVVVSKSLANVYMTILSNCIADSQGASLISDDPKLSEFSIFVRRQRDLLPEKESSILATQLPIVLPENLSQIDITRVMQLRNSKGFSEKRRAFHSIMQRIATAIESGTENSCLGTELKATIDDFSDDLASLGTGLASLTFGMWLVASGDSFGPFEAIRQVLAGAAFTVGGIIKIRNNWEHTSVKRLARRYVIDIGKLHPSEKSCQ